MCTAVTYQKKDLYFGRTLDHDKAYGETVTITPRNYPFSFVHAGDLRHHYAVMGMAHVAHGYPLYYDAVNEKGLAIAGLHFVGNAQYGAVVPGKSVIAQFELIPWLLGQCDSVEEARRCLYQMVLTDTAFHKDLPPAQLHWLIADRHMALTVESTAAGLQVYENPVGVLTNNPPFTQQLFRLNDYMHLSAQAPENRFSKHLPLYAYSRGMGALGLPGDGSSMSRFVRAAFVKMHAVSGDGEAECVSQCFHMLGAVEQLRGCCVVDDGGYEITRYTVCCNADRGIYYYTTYGNHQITAVDMHRENLDGTALVQYSLRDAEQIYWQN